jgi:acetolactate synthase-1/2/3 large subunit
MTVADTIAAFIAEKGITHAFGIIGAGNAALFAAIHRAKKTEIVCCHHEQAAVMAASYSGRVHRARQGVAIVTTGAGSSNAITGALAALMDSVPVLIISGNEPSKYCASPWATRVVGVQGFLTAEHVAPFVKEARAVTADRFSSAYLEDAWQCALAPRPGPVWLDFPRDVFNASVV